MLSDLEMFLTDNPVESITEEVKVSKRFGDHKFKINCITGEQLGEYQKQCMENPTSRKKRKFNTDKFNELIVVNHCVSPNFKNKEWLDANGCANNPQKLLNKVLTGIEIQELSVKIQELSGLDLDSEEEEIEEVKNS